MPSAIQSRHRVCFQLQVKPDRLDEYRERHAAVWPDMLRAIRRPAGHNYSLFLRDDGLLIGYVRDRRRSSTPRPHSARTDVNRPLGGRDGRLLRRPRRPPDEGFPRLTEVFHLEDQLAALDADAASDTARSGTSTESSDS